MGQSHLKYIDDIVAEGSCMLRSWQLVKNAQKHKENNRVVVLSGDSSSAKSRLLRNIRETWGVPVHFTGIHAGLDVSKFTMETSIRGGKFRLKLSDFLMQATKIDGIEFKKRDPNQIFAFDEANTFPQLWQILAGIVRGENFIDIIHRFSQGPHTT